MARFRKNQLFYNLIFGLILGLMLSSLGSGSVTALALEQEARCGYEEHVHTEDCYLGEVLLCRKKAHTHSENCYMVLLGDNDINWLLQTIDSNEDKSLEGVIDTALGQALTLNENLSAGDTQTVQLAAENISALNRIIEDNQIQPAVVLNERLSDDSTLHYTPPTEPTEEDAASTETTEAKTEPTKAPETTAPAETTKPAETTGETEPTETTSPETTEPTKPAETTEPTEATKPTEETTEPTVATEPTEETTEPTVMTEPTEETTEPTVATEPTEETTEPSVTTEPTEETTEPSVTTEPTEETTEPTVMTEPTGETTEPTVTTEPTEETTEPTVTTAPTEETTEPTVTTEPTQETTEPTVATDPTEETTEPTVTTVPTEETTAPTVETDPTEAATEPTVPEPAAPTFAWVADGQVTMLTEEEPADGKAGLYIYLDGTWACVDILDMDAEAKSWGTNHSLAAAAIRDGYSGSAVISAETLNSPLYYSTVSPAAGIEGITAASGETVYLGADGTYRHFYLVTSEKNAEGQVVYKPVAFHTVTLNYGSPVATFALTRSAGTTAEVEYVQSGQSLSLSEDYQWQDENGTVVTSLDSVTGTTTLYAVDTADTDTSGEEEVVTAAVEAPVEGQVGMYIYLDGKWTCIGILDITNFSVSRESICNVYRNATTVSEETLKGTLHYYSTSPEDGITNAYVPSYETIWFYSSPKYFFLVEKNTYTPIDFYTVTLDYSEITDEEIPNEVQYVESGQQTTLSPDFDAYLWYDGPGEDAAQVTSFDPTITGTTTLYARPKEEKVTVTFETNGGSTIDSKQVDKNYPVEEPDEPTMEGYTFGGWYSDETLVNSFDFATPITENTTLYAKWLKNCTVTYKDAEGNELAPSETVVEGTTVTLPEGYEWTYGDATYEPGTEVTITENTDFVGVLKTYTVTFVDENGNQTTQEVQYGKTITFADLPTGYVWAGSDGTDYPSGTESPEITGNMTFTATAKTITVSYDVNFPTSAELSAKYFALKTGESEATLVGDASVTLLPGSFAVIQNVSDQNVILYLTGHQNRYSAAHFLGWETETGAVISPDTKLDYAGLAVFDANGDGNVQLTGKWSYNQKTGVNFFVRYDIGSYDGDTSSTLYTDVVFTTYVGGLEDSDLGADALNTAYSKDASVKDTDGDGDLDAVLYKDDPTRYYEYDQLIRALYGEKADGVWLPEFPSDEDMLEVLKTKNTNNVIFAVEASTGNTVAVTDRSTLNTSNYTIRWYLFKYAFEGYGDYTWHIDGLLVKKQGQVTIDKEFLGDEAAIDAAEENFYVTAQNGTVTDGVFTPKTGDEAKSYTFDLSNTSSADAANHQYQWEISDVSLGEYWQITESASKVTVDGKEYIYYTEYSIYDSDGNITDIAEYGTTATVVGKTYAMDVDPDQGMLVEFKNYYYPSDTLLVKKEDADTGQPLGGAEFELWQYNTDGTPVQLKFSYNDALGMYQFDSTNGTVTTISTADTGYSNVALSGFSYEHGKVILKEVTAPSGYDPVPWIEIDTSGALSDVYYSDEDADDIASSDWGRYAEVHDDGHVLVVKDRTSEYVTVNVAKAWDPVDAAEENVTLVLQANGGRATNTFPTLSDAEVTIGEDDSWSYSWTGLPAFANGELVQWSVKEVAIGGEGTLTDGESFANWIYTASLTSRTDTNGNGIDDVWNYRVINTPRRTQIILTKTDVDGKALSGATFSLVEVELVDGEWQKVGIAARMTTNANGILSFDGLTAGAYYQLTETQAPDGYIAVLEPVVVTVNGEGLIQQVDSEGDPSELKGGYLIYTSAYNVQAVNLSAEPLPETGGAGATVYTQCGLFLMLFALLIYKKPHRKEETDSS